jgi:two-component system, NtrC family, sensor kinase
MTEQAISPRRYSLLCADDSPRLAGELAAQLRRLAGPGLEVVECGSEPQALEALSRLAAQGSALPVVFASGVGLLEAVQRTPGFLRTRAVRIQRDGRPIPTERIAIIHEDLVLPADDDRVRRCLSTQLTTYLLRHALEDVDRFGHLVDCAQLRQAVGEIGRSRQRLASQLGVLGRSFLDAADMTDEGAQSAMIRGLDEALNRPPPRHLAAGAALIREDEAVDGIWIVLDGKVQLTRRLGDEEVVLDPSSSGPIVGLLAMAQRQRAFFTGRALTNVRAIFVTWEQLDQALQKDPSLSVHFVAVLVRSLTKRLRNIVDLQIQVGTLNRTLAEERDQLARTLHSLEQAQIRLVAQEKMATLGQLAAKVAHEINNPIAAVHRSADYIAEDVAVLLGGLADFEVVNSVLQTALSESPLSTRELRGRREALSAATGDEELARRLLQVGITTIEEYRSALATVPADQRERRMLMMEHAYQLGVALRNIRSSARRVTDIVRSLKSYARGDQSPMDNVDIHEGLEDTLRLFGPTLMGLELVREYGELPRIQCRPGELNQVWTNLISNAVEAMGSRGTLTIRTDAPDPQLVRVRIIDTGSGIAPENLARIFSMNFTTKRGQGSQFGLGMGLVICRQIVTRHGGTITVDSRPGQTCFTVQLPVQGGASAEE